MKRRNIRRRWLFIIRCFFLVTIIVFLWSVSFCALSLSMPVMGQDTELDSLMTVLFGASSIALFLFSIIFGFFSLIEWQGIKARLDRVDTLDKEIQLKISNIERSTRDLIKPIELEMTARIHAMLGYFLGEVSLTKDKRIKSGERDSFENAVDQYETAYKLLQGVRGTPVEYMVLNNYLFYLSILNDPLKRDFLLAESRRMLREARLHGTRNLILTACKVILTNSTDGKERQEVIGLLNAIASDSKAPTKDRREAKFYLASLNEPSLS